MPDELLSDDEFEAEMERFYSLVGKSITRWAHIDRTIFDICRAALGISAQKTAAIYYRSPHIRDHAALTGPLVELTLSKQPAKLKVWSALLKRVTDLSKFRNQIAHNPVVFYQENDVVSIRTESSKLLRRHALKSKGVEQRKLDVLATKALESHHDDVCQLYLDLLAFSIHQMPQARKAQR